ncbi:hypothetical protein BD309DRAFT_956851 [Dichomitus squalens]|nr:hypothetical protein BD309DRAFT_956851 [Dichomitus squalens]
MSSPWKAHKVRTSSAVSQAPPPTHLGRFRTRSRGSWCYDSLRGLRASLTSFRPHLLLHHIFSAYSYGTSIHSILVNSLSVTGTSRSPVSSVPGSATCDIQTLHYRVRMSCVRDHVQATRQLCNYCAYIYGIQH